MKALGEAEMHTCCLRFPGAQSLIHMNRDVPVPLRFPGTQSLIPMNRDVPVPLPAEAARIRPSCFQQSVPLDTGEAQLVQNSGGCNV